MFKINEIASDATFAMAEPSADDRSTFDLTTTWCSIESAIEMLHKHKRHDSDDRISLREFLLNRGMSRVLDDLRVFAGPYWPVCILDAMDRWIQIIYPVEASCLTGAFGTAIRVSDVLRWLAEPGDSRAEYRLKLANALDADPAPRPVVSNPKSDREGLVLEYQELLRLMMKDRTDWSWSTLSTVECGARRALEGAAWGEVSMPPLIPFPVDYLPTGCKLTKDGYDGEVLSDVGWLLRKAIHRAGYITDRERHELKLASMFYPDPMSEVEVRLRTSAFEIGSFNVSRIHSADDIGALVGSVYLDHFGGANKFSPDPGEFPFRLHKPGNPHPEDDEHFYLVSELVTYVGFTRD